jgi:hypothetical protein
VEGGYETAVSSIEDTVGTNAAHLPDEEVGT